MLKSSGGIALATLTSRVLGMVREMVYFSFMGVSWINDTFQVAFQIPNLFRRLLGEGALTAAFIPIFKEKEKLEGEGEMWRAANAVISGLVIVATVVTAVAMLGISLALAAHDFAAKTELMLQLLRVMFPYMVLVCLAAAFMGMLNARGHFFIPALSATMLNVVMIASVLWLAPLMGGEMSHKIFALAIGVLAAGVAQALFQLPSLWSEGFRYRWVPPWRDETVRRVVYKMIPGAIGVAAFQINVAVVQTFSFWVSSGIVSSFNGAVRLMELPQGMFGISLATYLLPTLSSLATDKKFPEFRASLREGISTLVFMNLIASIQLVILAEPIIRLLFEHGAFDAEATQRVTVALTYLAPGLIAFSTVNILARAFYALGDTRTPMKISIACLALNLVFSVALVFPLHQAGLGLSNTATSIVNVSLLAWTLRRKLNSLGMAPLLRSLPALAFCGLLAGTTALWGLRAWESLIGHHSLALKIGAVFVPAAASALVYFGSALLLNLPAAREIVGLLFAKLRR
jgi:putative peptidoglycan lipid II flippase